MRSLQLAVLMALGALAASEAFGTDRPPWLELECAALLSGPPGKMVDVKNSAPVRYAFVEQRYSDAKNLAGAWFVHGRMNAFQFYTIDPHHIRAYAFNPGSELFDKKENEITFLKNVDGIPVPTYRSVIEFDRVNGAYDERYFHTDGTLKPAPLGTVTHRTTGTCKSAPSRKF
jgi:hypothetical protein